MKQFNILLLCFFFAANIAKASFFSSEAEQAQRLDLLAFTSDLLNEVVDLLEAYDEEALKNNRSSITRTLSANEILPFRRIFIKHQECLKTLDKLRSHNMFLGIDIIPDPVFSFLKERFTINPEIKIPRSAERSNQKFDEYVEQAIYSAIGGEYGVKFNNKYIEINEQGLFGLIKDYSFNAWKPIAIFNDELDSAMTHDHKLIRRIGEEKLQFLQKYYGYSDPISRLWFLKEVVDSVHKTLKKKALEYFHSEDNLDSFTDRVTLTIFQNSGPILIKFLQELQEAAVGYETPLNRMLEGLKHSKKTEKKTVIAKIVEEMCFLTVCKGKNTEEKYKSLKKNGFKLKKPLGVASIAETYWIKYDNASYAVKLKKPHVEAMFRREKINVQRMIEAENFGRGISRMINEYKVGIAEELDFNNERRNIRDGYQSYKDDEHNITTIRNAFHAESKSRDILVMTFAPGQPVGSFIDAEKPDQEILLSAIDGLFDVYRKTLQASLFGKCGRDKNYNVFHADPHRENVFFDPKSGTSCLIDFGFVGRLNPKEQKNFYQVFLTAHRTANAVSSEYDSDEAELDESKMEEEDDESNLHLALSARSVEDMAELDAFVANLKNLLLEIVMLEDAQDGLLSDTKREILKIYFDTSFDLDIKIPKKNQARDKINQIRFKLEEELNKVKEQFKFARTKGKRDELYYKHELLKDDLSLITSMLKNSFNGTSNELIASIVSDEPVSEKLAVIFRDLMNNGISIPSKLNRINRSKKLLEGLIRNVTYLCPDKDQESLEQKMMEIIPSLHPDRFEF